MQRLMLEHCDLEAHRDLVVARLTLKAGEAEPEGPAGANTDTSAGAESLLE